MDIHITSRHYELKEEEYAIATEAAMGFEKFSKRITRVDVIMCTEPLGVSCEFTVKLNGTILVAKVDDPEPTKAIHDAALKVHRQLAKIHDKAAKH
jgi:ribosomal subunit interface protein